MKKYIGNTVVYLATGLAAVAVGIGALYLGYDISTSVKDFFDNTPKDDVRNAVYIGSFGIGVLIFTKLIENPFDAAMNAAFPDDVPPKGVK